MAHHLRELIDLGRQQSVLVVGLGNQEITADSLECTCGFRSSYDKACDPGVWTEVKCTYENASDQRNRTRSDGSDRNGNAGDRSGVVSETKPDVVIAIDALAARSTARLNRTIQITDTGISPGSGVGNHREGLNEENLSVRVIGIGVPTVVDAATIVHDSMADLLDALEEEEQKEFLEEMISPKLYTMFVTPKDVDETVRYLSFTISEGLNMAFSDSLIEEDRS